MVSAEQGCVRGNVRSSEDSTDFILCWVPCLGARAVTLMHHWLKGFGGSAEIIYTIYTSHSKRMWEHHGALRWQEWGCSEDVLFEGSRSVPTVALLSCGSQTVACSVLLLHADLLHLPWDPSTFPLGCRFKAAGWVLTLVSVLGIAVKAPAVVSTRVSGKVWSGNFIFRPSSLCFMQ